jgi:hypothetical protein
MRTALLVSLPCLASFVGCTGTVATTAGSLGDADSTVTQALVLVERIGDPAEGTRAAASARFARVASGVSDADTLRAIGASLDLPARGSCARIVASDGTGAAEPSPVVELLDMGRVSIETSGPSGSVTALVPRQLPYVTDVVTGTVYARAAEAAVLPASSQYVIHVAGAAGTTGIAGFDVVAVAPNDASDIAIAEETAPGKIVLGNATLNFSWPSPAASPTASLNPASDFVYVEVQPSGVRCTLGDGLPAALPGDTDLLGPLAHGSVPTALLDDAGSIVVHRVHIQPLQPLQAPGIGSGAIRFDFARVVAYTRPATPAP